MNCERPWFISQPHTACVGINSRNYLRMLYEKMFKEWTSVEWDDDITNFDSFIFLELYDTAIALVENPTFNHRALVLYLVNNVYVGFMSSVLPARWDRVVWDPDVERSKAVFSHVGYDAFACFSSGSINFVDPVFNMDRQIYTYCKTADVWKRELYDDLFAIVASHDVHPLSLIGKVEKLSSQPMLVTYVCGESRYVDNIQRSVELDRREAELNKREEQFDADCESYELEATKWRTNVLSSLNYREEVVRHQLRILSAYEKIAMTANDRNVG